MNPQHAPNNRPKIALFLHSLGGGGSQQAILDLAQALADRSFDVTIVVWRLEGPLVSKIPSKVRTVVLRGRRLPRIIPALVRLLSREQFDAVVTGFTAINVAAIFARYIALAWNTRVILMEHTNFKLDRQSTQTGLSRLADWLRPLVYPIADRVVTISDGLRSLVLKHTYCSPNKVITIPYGFALSEIENRAKQPIVHKWLSSDQGPLIVTVARLEAQKDFDTLLRAFAILSSQRAAHLLILGDGSQRSGIEQLIQELKISNRVELIGFQHNPFAFVARADLFILSSHYEGFGRVIVEALACGTPVVSTDCAIGPAEILDGGRYGWLVPIGDVHRMTAAMLEAIDAPREPLRLKRRAQEYSVEKMTDRYLELLRSLGVRAFQITN